MRCSRGAIAAGSFRGTPNSPKKLVHTPVHASWLNQIEIYLSIVQRKVVTPNAFTSLGELQDRLIGFQARFGQTA